MYGSAIGKSPLLIRDQR